MTWPPTEIWCCKFIVGFGTLFVCLWSLWDFFINKKGKF